MAAERDIIEPRRCATCGGLVGYSSEELSHISTSAVYGVCSCVSMIPANADATLDRLVHEFLTAATYDVREFFSPDGAIQNVRAVPRPLTLLIKGVRVKRLIPVEWAEVLGMPAAEVVELKWESQAGLLLRAIELMTGVIERNRKNGAPMTDEEIEQGATQFVAMKHPELAAEHPEIFGAAKKGKP